MSGAQWPSPACNECSDTDIPVVILGFRDCGRSWAAEGALLAHSLPRSEHRWEPKKDRKKLETWKLISNHEVNIMHKYLSHSTYWKLFYLHWDVLRPNYISYIYIIPSIQPRGTGQNSKIWSWFCDTGGAIPNPLQTHFQVIPAPLKFRFDLRLTSKYLWGPYLWFQKDPLKYHSWTVKSNPHLFLVSSFDPIPAFHLRCFSNCFCNTFVPWPPSHGHLLILRNALEAYDPHLP